MGHREEGQAYCGSKQDLVKHLTMEQRLEGSEELATWMSERRAFRKEEKTSVKAQGQVFTWLTKDQ